MWAIRLTPTVVVALCTALQSSGNAVARSSPSSDQSASTERQSSCQMREALKRLPAALGEASGAAASRRHRGIVWTHNDSAEPVLFAVDVSDKVVGRVRLTGADVVDWESVTVAACPQGSCLFVGDIGDNGAKRDHVTVYRVREPALDAQSTESVTRLVARYPDGPRDAEALVVLPPEHIFIVTKGDKSPVDVYRFPEQSQSRTPAVLERVRTLQDGKVKAAERVTGADADPNGRWVVMRTGKSLSAFDANDFVAGGEPMWQMDLSSLGEPQGEGVALDSDGLVTLIGERGDGPSGTIARLQCAFGDRPRGTSRK
jgi:hypothetical protein